MRMQANTYNFFHSPTVIINPRQQHGAQGMQAWDKFMIYWIVLEAALRMSKENEVLDQQVKPV